MKNMSCGSWAAGEHEKTPEHLPGAFPMSHVSVSVGLAGFEPATPSPPDLYAKPLRYSPKTGKILPFLPRLINTFAWNFFHFSGNWLTVKHLTRVLPSPSLPDSTGEDVFYLPVEASELILSPFHQLVVQLTADPQRNLPPSLSRLIPR